MRVLHSICQKKFGKLSSGQRTGKGQFSFQPQRRVMPKNVQTTAQLHLFHVSKVMLKILQARFQQYINQEFPDVQTGFRKGRGSRDQISNIHWIIEKAREFQKNIYFCFIDYVKTFDCVDHNKLWKILERWEYQTDLSPEKLVFRSRSNGWSQTWNNRLVQDWERCATRLYIVTLFI